MAAALATSPTASMRSTLRSIDPALTANGAPRDGKTVKAPDFGSRLLPHVLDDLAVSDPNRVYAIYPKSADLGGDYRHVTMRELANAVNGFAHWLEAAIGKGEGFPTIAYFGLGDIRYTIVLLAAIKCGYKVLTPSHRNTAAITASLIRSVDCATALCAEEMMPVVRGVQEHATDLKIFAIEELEHLLSRTPKPYPYKADFETAKWDPILVLHSSGTTGPPKPVITNHASWALADRDRHVPAVKRRRNQNWALFNFDGGGRFFAAFPAFHLGGMMSLAVLPLYSTSATVVLGPAMSPPSGKMISEIMAKYPLRAVFAPPVMFEQFMQQPKAIEQAKTLDFMLYAGGPLTDGTGNALSEVTSVCQFYGATETNLVPTLMPRQEDWAYVEFHPSAGVEMQKSDDDAYELVLHRGKESEAPGTTFFCNFPSAKECSTTDLFRPHPTKPGLWKFHGRKDDIVVFNTAAKFNPVPAESILAGHELISAAVVVGNGRSYPALLVEPKDEVEMNVENFIDEIWPTLERANEQSPTQGRVRRDMIAVVRGFERAGKGTVIRRMTTAKFRTEIDELYEESLKDESHLTRPVASGKGKSVLLSWMRSISESLNRFRHLVSSMLSRLVKTSKH